MLPELAVAYIAGVVPSAIMTGLHVWKYRKKQDSPQTKILQANLAKVGMYWSDQFTKIISKSEETAEQEQQAFYKTISVVGGIAIILSWLGFFGLLLLYAAMNSFAVPREEKMIFATKLANEDLSEAQIRYELTAFEALLPKH